jgi:hypothetical protein
VHSQCMSIFLFIFPYLILIIRNSQKIVDLWNFIVIFEWVYLLEPSLRAGTSDINGLKQSERE